MAEFSQLKEIFSGNIPPRIHRFVKETGRGINEHKMIGDGDKVIAGISGGKDSLAMAMALSLRRKHLPIRYDLEGVMIEWKEHPLSPAYRTDIEHFFKILGVPFSILSFQMQPESFHGKFNCYLCARNRRRILFDYAAEKGIKKIAFGHHLDDLVETALMNLFHRGNSAPMKPVSSFFDGKIEIIRPLCLVKESTVQRLSQSLEFPILEIDCPFKEINLRKDVKEIIRQMTKIDPLTREHIYNAYFGKEKNRGRN